MAGETPFASLQSLPSFDDGPAESALDVVGLATMGSASHLSFGDGGPSGTAFGAAVPPAPYSTGSLPRSHTVANPFDVGEMLAHINACKLTGQRQQAAPGQGQLVREGSMGSAGGPTTLVDGASHSVKWVQPSGARQPGQGCEEIEQGIVFAEPTSTGGAVLRITLLAAGFIIGPSGASVRDICRLCGSDIKSWTCEPDEVCPRPTRQFRVEGPPAAVARSVEVMCDAVARYKDLCEGKYSGQSVPRMQHVSGIDFSYQPPPRNVVPFAASLKSQGSAKRQGSGQLKGGGGGGSHHRGRPPAGPSYKEAVARTGSTSLPPHAPAGPPMGRSSSLPPIPTPHSRPHSRSASPAPAGAGGPAAAAAACGEGISPGGGAGKAEVEQSIHGDGLPPSGRRRSLDGLPPASAEEPPLASPFGAAAEQQVRSAAGSGADSDGDSAGGGEQRRSLELPASRAPAPALPAPARTLGKQDVLRTVIGGISQQVASAATTAVPGLAPWVAQAVLLQQQHQQQLAATAAAAQAAFLAQGAMLAEMTALDPALAPYGALVGGGAQHTQLQAALAALGLEGGGDAGQGAAFQGGLGAGDGGGDWQAGNPALIGLQDYLSSYGAPRNGSGGVMPPPIPIPGPGTPSPSPLPAAPRPSPDHSQVLAALQVLSAAANSGVSVPLGFGVVGSPPSESPPHLGPTTGTHSPLPSPPATAPPASEPLAYSVWASPPAPGRGQGLNRASAPAPAATSGPGFTPALLGRAASADLSMYGAPPPTFAYSSANSFGLPADDPSRFLSAFEAPPVTPSGGHHLFRASSLAFSEARTQPPLAPVLAAGRSSSLPLYPQLAPPAPGGGLWAAGNPWADASGPQWAEGAAGAAPHGRGSPPGSGDSGGGGSAR